MKVAHQVPCLLDGKACREKAESLHGNEADQVKPKQNDERLRLRHEVKNTLPDGDQAILR